MWKTKINSKGLEFKECDGCGEIHFCREYWYEDEITKWLCNWCYEGESENGWNE